MTAGTVVAGGLRTPETKLTERFEVSADGRRLTITYTWDDPKIYQTAAHVSDPSMERLPAERSYALEEWCDASDPIEQQSIVPPKQLEWEAPHARRESSGLLLAIAVAAA